MYFYPFSAHVIVQSSELSSTRAGFDICFLNGNLNNDNFVERKTFKKSSWNLEGAGKNRKLVLARLGFCASAAGSPSARTAASLSSSSSPLGPRPGLAQLRQLRQLRPTPTPQLASTTTKMMMALCPLWSCSTNWLGLGGFPPSSSKTLARLFSPHLSEKKFRKWLKSYF